VSRATLAAAVVLAGALAGCGADSSGAPDAEAPAPTAKVERGPLADRVSQPGVLTFRARPDGAPYVAINQASGVYTRLPEPGDRVGCGEALYRVDDRPVLLLCGRVPAFRDLAAGETGPDVRVLNRTLRRADAGDGTDPRGDAFTSATAQALVTLQRARGMEETATLELGDAVVLPEPVRVAKVSGALGAPARPGTPVLTATSLRPQVRVDLDPTQRNAVRRGDRARVALPDHTTLTGRVASVGPAARADGAVTIPVAIRLDRPRRARGLEGAPVEVEIATDGVRDALSVPVTALVGEPGGGFAVEAVRADGRRERVAVTLGLVDTVAGRVQVEGDLRAGDDVVVPAS